MRLPKDQHSDTTRLDYLHDDLAEDNSTSQILIAEKLQAVQIAARAGQQQTARRLSQEITELVPDNVQAWLYRADLAEAREQKLFYLSKALVLVPQHMLAKRSLYQTLKIYLEQDPFLLYFEETSSLYRVICGEKFVITVPKDRAIAPSYPPTKPTDLQSAYRWLGFSLLGLLLAGLGTLVCAPFAALFAWRASHQPLTMEDRRRAQIALIYAAVLWMVGMLFSFLLLLHL
jgi:hypothetical protein